MPQETITLEHSVLVIDYALIPKLKEEKLYNLPGCNLVDCEVSLKKGRLFTSTDMVVLSESDLKELVSGLKTLTSPVKKKVEELRI